MLSPLQSVYFELFRPSRKSEMGRVAEHLYRSGSSFEVEKEVFLKSLKKRTGEGFRKLQSELEEAVPGILVEDRGSLWISRCKNGVGELKEGESLLIDATTYRGRHAMLMRVVREGEGYTLYYANTGGGLEKHPQKTQSEKTLYQRVLVFKTKEIPEAFFQQFAEAVLQKEGSIEAMYGVLNKHFKTPENRPIGTYPELWGREQFGGSCVASGIWALSKTLLSEEECFELKSEMRIKALLRSYRQLTKGGEPSETQKILVLEQVRKLQGLYDKKEMKKPVFNEIEQQLKERWGLKRAEAPLKLRSRKGIENLLVQEEGERLRLRAATVKMRKSKSSLEIGVSLKEKRKGKEAVEPLFELKRGEEGRLSGVSRGDSLYLFGLRLAAGEDEEAFRLLEELKEQFISEDKTELKKEAQAISFLCAFTLELIEADQTRSGIAKQLFLAELIATELSSLKEKANVSKLQLQSSQLLRLAKMRYQTLHVERYLPKDSVWLTARKQLKASKNGGDRPL